LREFVLTPVILTPGARGREGPGCDFLYCFVWIVVDWLDPVDLADCSKLGFRLRETLLLLNSKCHLFQDRGLWRVRRSNSDFGSLWRVRGRGKERVGRESVASKRGGKERARERERKRGGHKHITHSVMICTRMPRVRSRPLFWSSQALVATLHSDL
jgi:hypothetical protein